MSVTARVVAMVVRAPPLGHSVVHTLSTSLCLVECGFALPTNSTEPDYSEHGPICHLFELILVIHANTSNGTNHIV
jgi:hypothetical protein